MSSPSTLRVCLRLGTLGTLMLGLAPPVWAQTGPMLGPMQGRWWAGWWPVGGLTWLPIIGLAVIGLVAIIRWILLEKNPKSALPPGLAILEERYARGEIDREEYQQRRRDLGG